MKNYVLLFFPLFFVFSSFDTAYRPHTAAQAAEDPLDDWLVDNAQAQAMIKYRSCTEEKCKKPKMNLSKSFVNNGVLNAIHKRYNVVSYRWVPARYRDEDVERYKRARKITGNKAEVSGYETMLLEVTVRGSTSGFAGEVEDNVLYFDLYTICPPPNNC